MKDVCNLCNSKIWIYSDIKPKAWRTTSESFNLMICANCGLMKTYPIIPEDKIAPYYASENYDSHIQSVERKNIFDIIYAFIQKLNAKYKYSIIKKALNGDTKNLNLLDYGCGNGSFLNIVNKRFLNVKGVEFESRMVQYCRSRGLNVYLESEFFSNQEYFDVVTLFHVLEHLYDPLKYLKMFSDISKKDAILLLALPNPKSYDCAFYKNDWAAWDVPIHLHHFTPEVIIKMAEKADYDFLFKKPLFFDAFYVSILSEKIRKNSAPFLRGILRGFISNLKAMSTQEYSSLIYVFRKNQR